MRQAAEQTIRREIEGFADVTFAGSPAQRESGSAKGISALRGEGVRSTASTLWNSRLFLSPKPHDDHCRSRGRNCTAPQLSGSFISCAGAQLPAELFPDKPF